MRLGTPMDGGAGDSLNAFARAVGEQSLAQWTQLQKANLGDATFENAMHLVLREALAELQATGCFGVANQVPSQHFWSAARECLELGSLQLHARQKPFGYAGDHELLDRICREDVRGNPMGRAFDSFFQRQAAPTAVRNRSRELAATIVHEVRTRSEKNEGGIPTIRVASVGSGPAWNIRWALESLESVQRAMIHVTLVDLDPKSLALAKSSLAGLLPVENLNCIRANLKRLPRLPETLASLGECDLIDCPGFFDYLSDNEAIDLLRALWQQVAVGGALIAFNFDERNPSRAYMEWVGNWYLIYRTRDAMERLAEEADLPGATVEVGVEPAGVNLYWRFVRKEG